MDAALWVTLIIGVTTPICTLLGVIVANKKTSQKQAEQIEGYKQLTVYRIEQLEAKQDKHNNHTERLYKLEGKVNEIVEEMKSVRENLLNK